jgi:SET domain
MCPNSHRFALNKQQHVREKWVMADQELKRGALLFIESQPIFFSSPSHPPEYGINEIVNKYQSCARDDSFRTQQRLLQNLYPRTLFEKAQVLQVSQLWKTCSDANFILEDARTTQWLKIMCNSITSKKDGRMLVYEYGSYFNHSCLPNAKFVIDSRTQQLSVIALRDISQYEEITCSWIPSRWHGHSQYIQLCFGFTCTCSACFSSPAAASAAAATATSITPSSSLHSAEVAPILNSNPLPVPLPPFTDPNHLSPSSSTVTSDPLNLVSNNIIFNTTVSQYSQINGRKHIKRARNLTSTSKRSFQLALDSKHSKPCFSLEDPTNFSNGTNKSENGLNGESKEWKHFIETQPKHLQPLIEFVAEQTVYYTTRQINRMLHQEVCRWLRFRRELMRPLLVYIHHNRLEYEGIKHLLPDHEIIHDQYGVYAHTEVLIIVDCAIRNELSATIEDLLCDQRNIPILFTIIAAVAPPNCGGKLAETLSPYYPHLALTYGGNDSGLFCGETLEDFQFLVAFHYLSHRGIAFDSRRLHTTPEHWEEFYKRYVQDPDPQFEDDDERPSTSSSFCSGIPRVKACLDVMKTQSVWQQHSWPYVLHLEKDVPRIRHSFYEIYRHGRNFCVPRSNVF